MLAEEPSAMHRTEMQRPGSSAQNFSLGTNNSYWRELWDRSDKLRTAAHSRMTSSAVEANSIWDGNSVQLLSYSTENNRANPKAAAAARLPVSVVCIALRSGDIPATRPLMKPKTASATIVMRTDHVNAEYTLCRKM